jgi:hypothetical protein
MGKFWIISATFSVFGMANVLAAENTDSGHSCSFPTRCYEESECQNDENFSVLIDEQDGKRPQINLPKSSIPAIRQLDINNPDTMNTISYVSDIFLNTLHLITIHQDGSARMSSHSFLDAAFTIESVGFCVPK